MPQQQINRIKPHPITRTPPPSSSTGDHYPCPPQTFISKISPDIWSPIIFLDILIVNQNKRQVENQDNRVKENPFLHRSLVDLPQNPPQTPNQHSAL